MSHYVVLVMVPSDGDTDEHVERLLEPFDENTQVPEYEARCYCVGRIARSEAQRLALARFGGADKLREEYQEALPLRLKGKHEFMSGVTAEELQELDDLWKKHIAKVNDLETTIELSRPDRGQPHAGCEECKGTGKVKSTYNPNSKWDWYAVGGRWDGFLPGEKNRVPAASLADVPPAEWCAYSIVTPDGTWHTRGKMGWFGMSTDDLDLFTWRGRLKELVASNADGHDVVAVDCHI